jgi:opacity protein-like surface antigen
MLQPTFSRSILINTLVLTLGLVASSSIAQADSLLQKMNFQTWYLGANLGTSMPSISGGATTLVPASGDVTPLGVANTNSVSGAMAFSLEGGAQFAINHADPTAWFNYYRLGLRYHNQAAEKLTGRGSVGATADAYDYTYKAQSQFILLDSALGLYDWRKVSTFFHLGFGMANTTTNAYSETDTDALPDKTSYAFSNGSATTMVAVVGLGVDYSLTKKWHANLSYDYFMPVKAVLGSGTLGTAAGGGTLPGPQAKLMNQTISLGIRYQF